MKPISSFACVFLTVLFLQLPCQAQCSAPEIVQGADKLNQLVCQGVAAAEKGENQKALGLFLAASKEPIFELPNIVMFGRIAETYARLGQFNKADVYLKYDDLSLLWAIGVVRCQEQSNMNDEQLFQDGKLLRSAEAKHMEDVLCGPIFDEYSYFRDRGAESFVPVAKEILRYDALRKRIDAMRAKKQSAKKGSK